MSENEELEFENPLEEEVESIDVPSDKRKVYTELGDPEVDGLYGKSSEVSSLFSQTSSGSSYGMPSRPVD